MDETRRCTARSSRTGQRCRKAAVIGASVCATHGAGARQVKEAARRRAALERATRDAAALGELGPVDPFEALENALALAHRRLAALARLDARDAAIVRAEGDALDRVVRAAKVIADLDVAERHRHWIERTATTIARAFDAALADEHVGDERRAALVRRFHARLQEVERRAPSP